MLRGSASALSLALISLLSTIAASHAFYVTVCQIDHNVATESLEITFKFFTDDLERALRQADDDDIRLVRGSTDDDADSHVLAYLQKKFELTVNDRPVELRYVGKEVEIDSTYVYLEVLNTPRLSKIAVRSSILLELFEDHTTILHVRTVGRNKSLVLQKDSESGVIELLP